MLKSRSKSASWTKRVVLFFFLYWVVFGQTRVSVTRQTQEADFTAFPATKPLKMGTILPATCGLGEMFFNSSAAPGQNVSACAPANQWTTIGASSSSTSSASGLPPQTGAPAVLISNGAVASWGSLPTGASGAIDCTSSPGVCDLVSSIVPFKTSANTWTGVNKFAQLEANVYAVAALPPCNSNFEGQMLGVADALAPSYLGVVVGGGTQHIPVYCNGTAWVAH